MHFESVAYVSEKKILLCKNMHQCELEQYISTKVTQSIQSAFGFVLTKRTQQF